MLSYSKRHHHGSSSPPVNAIGLSPPLQHKQYHLSIPLQLYPRRILADPSPLSSGQPHPSSSISPKFASVPLLSSEDDSPTRPRAPPLTKRKITRTRSSSNVFGSFVPPSGFLFAPAETSRIAASRSTSVFPTIKSISSPFLHSDSPPPYSSLIITPVPHMQSDSEDDQNETDMIYTSRLAQNKRSGSASTSSSSLRFRMVGGLLSNGSSRSRDKPKPICTTPGKLCAGETETETDEPSRHLPTARIVYPSGPLVPPNNLQERLTPFLFEFSRLLSIVPAVFGTLYNLYRIYCPPTSVNNGRLPPDRVDYFISALWAILTGYQCLCLTTGLLTRWRLYYPPLSTLVRLLALQGICWPATQLTLTILEHEKRPVIVWAVIGTTTCMSRSVQIWVTSNLWWEKRDGKDGNPASGNGVGQQSPPVVVSATEETRQAYWKRWGGGGKWGGRRWDWKEVGVKCVLPAGIVYFVMAWAEQLKREFIIC